MRFFRRKGQSRRGVGDEISQSMAFAGEGLQQYVDFARAHPEMFDMPVGLELATRLSAARYKPPVSLDILQRVCETSIQEARERYHDPFIGALAQAAVMSAAATLMIVLGRPGLQPAKPTEGAIRRALSVIGGYLTIHWLEAQDLARAPDEFARATVAISTIDPLGASFLDWRASRAEQARREAQDPDNLRAFWLYGALYTAFCAPLVKVIPPDTDDLLGLIPVASRTWPLDIVDIYAVPGKIMALGQADFVPRVERLLEKASE